MKAIAIETSGKRGSVAILQAGQLQRQQTFPADFKHAAGIITVLNDLLTDLNWAQAEVNELYVSAGPGSFTGLRVGITVAKTFCFATGAKLVAVPSTLVLAHNAPADANVVVVVLDAKRGQIFTARYHRDGLSWMASEPAHLDTLAAMLDRAPRPIHLLGDGLPYHLPPILPEGVIVTSEAAWVAQATVVARLGYAMARRGEFTDAAALVPTYIRRPEAEEKWDAAHGG